MAADMKVIEYSKEHNTAIRKEIRSQLNYDFLWHDVN